MVVLEGGGVSYERDTPVTQVGLSELGGEEGGDEEEEATADGAADEDDRLSSSTSNVKLRMSTYRRD